jgi:hypothetical protein
VRQPAAWILDAATEELSRLEVVASSITLPSLETVLAAAEGWEAASSRLRWVSVAKP